MGVVTFSKFLVTSLSGRITSQSLQVLNYNIDFIWFSANNFRNHFCIIYIKCFWKNILKSFLNFLNVTFIFIQNHLGTYVKLNLRTPGRFLNTPFLALAGYRCLCVCVYVYLTLSRRNVLSILVFAPRYVWILRKDKTTNSSILWNL